MGNAESRQDEAEQRKQDRGDYVPLMIQQKVEDMIFYGNQALLNFPRAERYAMAADIKQSMYTLYRLIVTANKKYYKKTTLQDAARSADSAAAWDFFTPRRVRTRTLLSWRSSPPSPAPFRRWR